MVEDMNALDDNCTWDFVTLPVGSEAFAKGYAQTYRVDYVDDTFSPIAKMASIKLFISLASIHHVFTSA